MTEVTFIDWSIIALSKVDDTVIAESRIGFSRFRIDGNELEAARGNDNPFLLAIRPVINTAMLAPMGGSSPLVVLGIVYPQGLAGAGVDGGDLGKGGARVHDPVYDDGRCLKRLRSGPIQQRIHRSPTPRLLEVVDIGTIDLVEGGVFRAALVPSVMRPMAICGA